MIYRDSNKYKIQKHNDLIDSIWDSVWMRKWQEMGQQLAKKGDVVTYPLSNALKRNKGHKRSI